jgi:hypothetical protein
MRARAATGSSAASHAGCGASTGSRRLRTSRTDGRHARERVGGQSRRFRPALRRPEPGARVATDSLRVHGAARPRRLLVGTGNHPMTVSVGSPAARAHVAAYGAECQNHLPNRPTRTPPRRCPLNALPPSHWSPTFRPPCHRRGRRRKPLRLATRSTRRHELTATRSSATPAPSNWSRRRQTGTGYTDHSAAGSARVIST